MSKIEYADVIIQSSVFDDSGKFSLRVLGAKGGVVNTVKASIGGITLQTTHIFRSRSSIATPMRWAKNGTQLYTQGEELLRKAKLI